MEIGTISELGERHSGLIRRKGVREHLFFHADALSGIDFGELKVGDKVSFAITQSKKGPYASKVTKR